MLRSLLPNGVNGITFSPFGVYIRREYIHNGRIVRHELIHWRQQWELLIIPFYIWYGLEALIKWSYEDISFEREAYAHASDQGYLEKGKRRPFAWLRYLR
jgi:hypothetical protein